MPATTSCAVTLLTPILVVCIVLSVASVDIIVLSCMTSDTFTLLVTVVPRSMLTTTLTTNIERLPSIASCTFTLLTTASLRLLVVTAIRLNVVVLRASSPLPVTRNVSGVLVRTKRPTETRNVAEPSLSDTTIRTRAPVP